ncbi:MAG TPA: discoidin domain-containing protein [Herpetosiphonaceae bacterium]
MDDRNRRGRMPLSHAIRAGVALLLLALAMLSAQPPAHGQSANLALNKPVSVSSTETADFPGAAAVDGNPATRWASLYSDPQWLQVDFGAIQSLSRVVLRWEAAFARGYQVQLSVDGSAWTTVYATSSGDGGVDDLAVSGAGRFLRVTGTARATQWGYSLWEIEAYGAASPTATPQPPTPTRTATATPVPPGGNLALNKPASASSSETADFPASRAVDGNPATRWASLYSDPQWLQVDFGASQSLSRVVLRWEAAFARGYQVQLSNDGSAWTTVYATSSGDGGVDDLAVSGAGRFLRVTGTARATQWGYSLWEIEAYGEGGPTATPQPFTPTPTPVPPTPTRTATPTPGGGKVVGGYWPFWPTSPVRIRDVHPGYNLIYLFSARPVGGSPGTTGAVYWSAPGDGRGAATNLRADIQHARTVQGRKIILSVGGAGFGMSFPDRTKSQNFVNSIVDIYNQLGGFDGLDWNTFEADQAPDTEEMIWISLELKRRYPGFLITAPPAPWNARDKEFCRIMVQRGAMDYAAPQYYDGPNLADPNYVANNINEWVGLVGADHLVVGFGINPGVANYMTVEQAIDAWNRVEANHPAIRGGFVWQIHTDETQGWVFPTRVGPLIR